MSFTFYQSIFNKIKNSNLKIIEKNINLPYAGVIEIFNLKSGKKAKRDQKSGKKAKRPKDLKIPKNRWPFWPFWPSYTPPNYTM